MFKVENADDLALIDKGNGKLGADLGVGFDVAGILTDVGSEDRFAELGGGSDEAFAQGDGAFAGHAFAEAGGEAVLEELGAVVPQKDGEHVKVDDALEELSNAF